MQGALRKSLKELFPGITEDQANRFYLKSFHSFMQELKGEKKITLDNIRQAADRCRKCQDLQPPTVHSQGSAEAIIMLVGEAPGEEEQIEREPFVGKAGQLLRRYLVEAELAGKNLLYISNICRCRPPKNRMPHAQEIKNCFPWLLAEIDVLRPLIIVTLGLTASKTFLGAKCGKMEDIHGKMYVVGAQVIMPTYHPSAVLRGQKVAEEALKEDLDKLHKLTDQLD
jgi:DNA polymerase